MKKSPETKRSLIRFVTWILSITAVMYVSSVPAQQINPLESDPRAAGQAVFCFVASVLPVMAVMPRGLRGLKHRI